MKKLLFPALVLAVAATAHFTWGRTRNVASIETGPSSRQIVSQMACVQRGAGLVCENDKRICTLAQVGATMECRSK